MTTVAGLLLEIGKSTVPPEQGAGTMYIIIQPPYAHLQKDMLMAFGGQEDVNIIVDRRYGERRASQRPLAPERRVANRRRSKEPLVEVVLSV